MKNKAKIFFLFLFASVLAITGCGKKETNKEKNDPNFSWTLSSKKYLNNKMKLVVGSKKYVDDIVYLMANDMEIEEDTFNAVNVSFNYTVIGINSENTNNAADYFYLNSEKISKIKEDGDTGVVVPESKIFPGQNIVTLTIGQYWSKTEYQETAYHGNNWQSCDDFQLGNFHLTLPTLEKVYPTTIRKYYAKKTGIPVKVNNQVIVDEPYDPTQIFWIGDGYKGHDTYYGHEDPRYNIPYKVEFIFDYQKQSFFQFDIDSTRFENGNNNFGFYVGNKKVLSKTILVDNEKPTINASVLQDSIVNVDVESFTSSVTDGFSGIESSYLQIDGVKYEHNAKFPDTLNEGRHTMLIYAADKAGNETYKTIEFYASEVGKFSNYKSVNLENGVKFDSSETFNAVSYSASKVNTTLSEGTLSNSTKTNLSLPTTSKYSDKMPYHSMTFTASENASKVLVNYEGGTTTYERFAIKALNNTTNKMDTLATGYGIQNLKFVVDTTKYVSANNQVELIITPDFVDNGADTMMWVTDTQHYTKFDDLVPMLNDMMEYCALQYTTGVAGYYIHTGDLVDDSINSTDDLDMLEYQWETISYAQSIVEESGMPNGVVTGNHDTGSSLQTLDYTYYSRFFGQERYNDKPWFGGSINNNASHYDLITIANQDFMVLYLGYGVEGDGDTVAWANDVISRFPNRTVILATHDYLEYNGGNGRVSENSRYHTIFDEIITPNENVRMVLCGHSSGAFHRAVDVPGSDRKVYEILSDYQSIDSEPDKHVIGSVKGCGGDGYLRHMKFDEDSMYTKTYSNWYKKYNPYGAKDEFTIPMDYVENNRVITSNVMEVYALSNEQTANQVTTYTVNTSNNQNFLVILNDVHGNTSYTII